MNRRKVSLRAPVNKPIPVSVNNDELLQLTFGNDMATGKLQDWAVGKPKWLDQRRTTEDRVDVWTRLRHVSTWHPFDAASKR